MRFFVVGAAVWTVVAVVTAAATGVWHSLVFLLTAGVVWLGLGLGELLSRIGSKHRRA